MGIKTVGLHEVGQMLVRLDMEAKRRVLHELMVEGKKLQLLAIRMAPVDRHGLENAIKMRPDTVGPARDAIGRFMRKEVEVYVDFSVAVEGRPGHTVGEYAWEIHEHLFPMGDLNLGEDSIKKQILNPDIVVGGGFLDRAAEVIETGMDSALQRALAGLL